MYQRPESIVPPSQCRHDPFDHFAVSELNIGAGRIDEELLDQVAGELILVFEQGKILVDVGGGFKVDTPTRLFHVTYGRSLRDGTGTLVAYMGKRW